MFKIIENTENGFMLPKKLSLMNMLKGLKITL